VDCNLVAVIFSLIFLYPTSTKHWNFGILFFVYF